MPQDDAASQPGSTIGKSPSLPTGPARGCRSTLPASTAPGTAPATLPPARSLASSSTMARLLSGTMLMGLAAGIALGAPVQAAAQTYQGADGQYSTGVAGGAGSDPGLNDGGAPIQNGQGAAGPVAGGAGGPGLASNGGGGNGGFGGGSGELGALGGGGGGGGIESAGRGGGGGGSIASGGGGGGGVGHVVTSDMTLVVGGSSTGGRGGGVGGDGSGGGGGGGGGVLLDGIATLTNQGTIAGGAGDQGGGGGGGALMTGAGTVVNEGAIRGGTGGIGKYSDSTDGAGGIGIAAIGGATVINSGVIAGGFSRNSNGVQAAAISFMGGANRLELWNGSVISGNVVSAGGDTLVLGGTVDSGFNLGQIGAAAQYQGFSFFEKTGASTWTLTGTGAQNWWVAAGALIGNTASLSGNLSFANGAGTRGVVFDQASAGTYAGTITGDGSVTKTGAGTLTLTGTNDYTGGTTIAGGTLSVGADANLGDASGALTFNGGMLQVTGTGFTSTARTINWGAQGGGFDIANQANTFTVSQGLGGSGGLTKLGAGMLTLTGANSYSGGTTISAGTLQIGAGGTSGSLTGDVVSNGTLAFNRSDRLAFTGAISGTGTLRQEGSGTTVLSGVNTYTGATLVNAGTLAVNGSIATSSSVTVAAGATLGGTGTVGNTIIAGGTLSPGNSIGTLGVQGNLSFTAASTYKVEVDPLGADRTNVTGMATLGGATVAALYAPGAYVTKQYTILNAAGGVSGTFGTQANTNLPANFTSSLSYDANNAYLNLALNFVPSGPSAPSFSAGLNANQSHVATALVNSFNTAGGIPLAFGALSSQGLTQASGEVATGVQQTSFSATSQFLGAMLDPFAVGRDNGVGRDSSAGQGLVSSADSGEAGAYASLHKGREPSPALARKATFPSLLFTPRWGAWAAGYGGAQIASGNAAIGSADTTARIYGMTVGADYRFAPETLVGFSLGGASTNYSLSGGLGKGSSEMFQAGLYGRHQIGAAYVAGALAYGWQDITTDRNAFQNHYRARFDANALSGRIEGGYRFAWQGMGLTPYAAGQFSTLFLPAYAEQTVAGNGLFALNYASKDVTSSRSELGLRGDLSFALDQALVTLRGRTAWAHNFTVDRSILASFQALPASGFTVNGAAQAHNAALLSVGAEIDWRNGFTLAANFDGEFARNTQSYAGKASIRYQW
ncbi:autotransporter domain-containing protein [Bosea sp. 685]|uniref:autotransporter domain-containing protein n=1 Tax=Bosea sp. 685 TaxID=3080057 RepID=UPI002892DA08|nr:autotransporter domain-containing protein [Bosea sp. 685]WNJ88252.1 autotransporter domain-containing protein [Bosea sp. 685]